jgi:hypothetical protein
MLRFRCDLCGQTFEDTEDCEGRTCNRCDDGTIVLDVESMSDDEVEAELKARGIDVSAAWGRVRQALRRSLNEEPDSADPDGHCAT